jgi:pilus assembly protein CpaF
MNGTESCAANRPSPSTPLSLRTGLEVIANQLGKKLDEDNPLLHAQLPDGSRLAAVIPPVVRPAPALTIRKFPSRHYTVDDLIARGTLNAAACGPSCRADSQREDAPHQRRHLYGKTTVLRAFLATAIPDDQRIVVIEDTSELHLQKPNLLSVECQTDTFKASITFDDLLKSALRWRPDRIILGEVRGIEARTLLDSLNTGHTGSLATIHANSAAKALRRFANLVLRSHSQATFEDVEAEIGEAVDYVVHVEREPGRRVVREVLRLEDYDRRTQQFNSRRFTARFNPQPPTQFRTGKDTPSMPLLEIIQTRQVTASIRLDEPTAALIDQYAAFLHASADEVVDKALCYVFAKDRDFQDFLRTPEAAMFRRAFASAARRRTVPQRSLPTALRSPRNPGGRQWFAPAQLARAARQHPVRCCAPGVFRHSTPERVAFATAW